MTTRPSRYKCIPTFFSKNSYFSIGLAVTCSCVASGSRQQQIWFTLLLLNFIISLLNILLKSFLQQPSIICLSSYTSLSTYWVSKSDAMEHLSRKIEDLDILNLSLLNFLAVDGTFVLDLYFFCHDTIFLCFDSYFLLSS